MAEHKVITIILKGINENAGEKTGEKTNKKKKSGRDELRRELDRRAWNMAKTVINTNMSRYSALTEDYLAQNTLNFVHKSLDIVDKFENTFTLASQVYKKHDGGLTGFGLGFIQVAGTALNMYYQNQSKLSSMYRQLNSTNYQTGLDASRAGLINNGRGTEN